MYTLLRAQHPTSDIPAISETGLNSTFSDASLHIPGFILCRRDRGTCRGSGVFFFVRDSVCVKKSFAGSQLGAL